VDGSDRKVAAKNLAYSGVSSWAYEGVKFIVRKHCYRKLVDYWVPHLEVYSSGAVCGGGVIGRGG